MNVNQSRDVIDITELYSISSIIRVNVIGMYAKTIDMT